MGYKITIDGPSGSGKGYVAGEISKKLNIVNIDTGAMYRAIGLYCVENKVDLEQEREIINALENIQLSLEQSKDKIHIYLNDIDVSDKIRNEKIGFAAAKVSKIPEVREYVVSIQRMVAGKNNVVTEGRDIGSVVFPEAELKIYLTATETVRAERRLKDLLEKGHKVTFEEVLEDIRKRDLSDMTRKISPLIKTDDMIEVDTTNLNKQEVVKKVLELVNEKGLVE